jgi:hypothetical protein
MPRSRKNIKRNKKKIGGSRSDTDNNDGLSELLRQITLKGAKSYAGPTPACCPNNNNLKFVRVHGRTPNPIYDEIITFEIPQNTYIITLVQPGDDLMIPNSIKRDIFSIYKGNKTLFQDNDKSVLLTLEGSNIMDKYNEYSKRDDGSPMNLIFRNHIPGMIMNNLELNFNDPGCTERFDTSCRIFCLNKKDKTENECLPKFINRSSGRHNIIKGLLSDLVDNEGPGTYILNICRGVSYSVNKRSIAAMRALSGIE